MAKKGRTGVLKRMRELKKAEKAALKREQMRDRKSDMPGEEPVSAQVATRDDLAGYGFDVEEEVEESETAS